MTEDFTRAESKNYGLVTKCVAAAAVAAGGVAYMQSKRTPLRPHVPNAEFFMQIGEYDDAKPQEAQSWNSDCSASELAYIDAGIAAALPALQWSLANENEYLFKKWFGTERSTDDDVRWILNEATQWMSRRGTHWNPLCCKSNAGACSGCVAGSGTQAFVTAGWSTRDPSYMYNNTWIRLCAAMMNSAPEQVGFIMFHELIHVTSQVEDSQMGYGKGPLVQLAAQSPNAARTSANNYMLYAAQNGLSFDAYNDLSGGWGANAFDPNCMDSHTNCPDMAENCCGNTDLSTRCCASCMIFDSTTECLQKNYPYRPGHGMVFDPDQPGLGLINNPNPPVDHVDIPEPLCTAANGTFGCGDRCGDSCDCYTGMTCSRGICVDEWTATADYGNSCDAWENEHGQQQAGGSKDCNEACGHSDECAADLFCCPNWSKCMDTSTYSTQGPNCGRAAAGGGAAPVEPDLPPSQGCAGTEYCEIGDKKECANANSSQLQQYDSTISSCYQMCLDQGNCHYFLRDAGDGECRGYLGSVEAGACQSPYANSNYYDLYQINYEPTPEAGVPGPGVNGIPLLLNARTFCGANYTDLSNIYGATVQDCADDCNAYEGCEFFMFQEAWGHCLASHTAGPNCPEGTFPGTEYDFYAVNGGQGTATPAADSVLTMLGAGQECGPRGVKFGNVQTYNHEACADKCRGQAGCSYFLYDYNDGECVQIDTSDDTCNGQLVSSRYYDFFGV